MNINVLIKWSNRILLFTSGLIIYWVFIFICISVFGLKVFAENTTQLFFLSIMALLCLALATTVLSISANLTKISNHISRQDQGMVQAENYNKMWLYIFLLSFPLLAGFLYAGDLSTTHKKQAFIIESAEYLIKENSNTIEKLTNYSFTKNYAESAATNLTLLTKLDEHFPNVTVITTDRINGKDVFLIFDSNCYSCRDEVKEIKKEDFIFSGSKDEREYLKSVFNNSNTEKRFSAHDGNYELFYPVKLENRTIVLHLSDYAQYGKSGS